MKIILKNILFLYLLFFAINCFALIQDEKLWLGINTKQSLSEHWDYFVFSQARLINQPQFFQVGLIEGAIGYHSVKHLSFWLGYRWSGHNPYNNFYQENRLIQQFNYDKNLAIGSLVSRTRLEETERGDSSQISIRLRQRLALQLEKELVNNIKPYFYDEIFFQLHSTDYTPTTFFAENRLFIGFNFYVCDKTWWEIGYINQYIMKTPQDDQNKMYHIASFTYNF